MYRIMVFYVNEGIPRMTGEYFPQNYETYAEAEHELNSHPELYYQWGDLWALNLTDTEQGMMQTTKKYRCYQIVEK